MHNREGSQTASQTASQAGAIIAVQGIGKTYPKAGGSREVALHNLDLTVAPGAILGLLGPNGAGKTTLIKILAGLLRPDTGDGTVLGYRLLRQHADVRARVSLVAPTADVGIDNNLTVRQNLTFWAPIYGLQGARVRARIDELLGKLGLAAKADVWPMHISAGQRQRLALARSLLAENRLVFLDEPTNKLDLEGVRSVRQMIAELNREQGATIILTTHVMEEAEELCGEIVLLRQGELIAHQPTAELTRSLHLARPITVSARAEAPQDVAAGRQDWERELAQLPGVTGAGIVGIDSLPNSSSNTSLTARSNLLLTVVVDSLDLRATTPALLTWVRERGLALVSMRAEPVTLTDVFTALVGHQQTKSQGSADREEKHLEEKHLEEKRLEEKHP